MTNRNPQKRGGRWAEKAILSGWSEKVTPLIWTNWGFFIYICDMIHAKVDVLVVSVIKFDRYDAKVDVLVD